MKTRLRLSVALNVTLLAAFALLAGRPGRSSSSREAPAPPVAAAGSTRTRPAVAIAAGAGLPLEELRRAGVSGRLIAAVAAADYEEKWRNRLLAQQEEFARGEISEVELELFVAAHEDGLEARMRHALGEAGFREWDQERQLKDFDLERLQLSGPEQESLYQLRRGLLEERRKMQAARLRGEIDEGDLERLSEAAHDACEQRLKDLLGETRYTSLQSGDNPSGGLRRHLTRLHVSDAQVEILLAAQGRWLESQNQSEADGPTHQEMLQSLAAQRDEVFLQTLGPFAELQKNQDSRYQAMQRHAKAWNLSGDDITWLYASLLRHDSSEQEHRQRMAETAADPEAEQSMLRDLERQVDQDLRTYLGSERFERLKQARIIGSGR